MNDFRSAAAFIIENMGVKSTCPIPKSLKALVTRCRADVPFIDTLELEIHRGQFSPCISETPNHFPCPIIRVLPHVFHMICLSTQNLCTPVRFLK